MPLRYRLNCGRISQIMKVQRALKTRLDLTPAQAEMVSNHGGAARFVYNWGLEQRQKAFQETGKGLNYPQQNKALTVSQKRKPLALRSE